MIGFRSFVWVRSALFGNWLFFQAIDPERRPKPVAGVDFGIPDPTPKPWNFTNITDLPSLQLAISDIEKILATFDWLSHPSRDTLNKFFYSKLLIHSFYRFFQHRDITPFFSHHLFFNRTGILQNGILRYIHKRMTPAESIHLCPRSSMSLSSSFVHLCLSSIPSILIQSYCRNQFQFISLVFCVFVYSSENLFSL